MTKQRTKKAATKRSAKVTPKRTRGRVAKKKTRGRPPKRVDLKLVEELANIGCTWNELAQVLGMARSTLAVKMKQANFRTAYEKGRAEFRISLRREQKAQADKGNVTMLIWLGKQELDQRDTQFVTVGDVQEILRDGRARMSAAAERLAASNPTQAKIIKATMRAMRGALAD